jgi:hypothetical protein
MGEQFGDLPPDSFREMNGGRRFIAAPWRESTMLRIICPESRTIAKLLREKYDAQFAMVVSDAPAADLRRGRRN